jgi:RNA polymerase sigma factor (TIGR02999 family)
MGTDVTRILNNVQADDPTASEKLLPLVYAELRRLAAIRMAQEQPGITLQPTALVHEAYIRLVGGASEPKWENRGHFFGAAAEAMRRILIDEARKRLAAKRGGGGKRQALELDEIAEPESCENLIALNDALDNLAKTNPQVAELVKLRYFAGLTVKDAAACLGIATRTADNYWAYAKAFLLNVIEANRA